MTIPQPAFSYIQTDIPEGVTIREWRRNRAPRYKRSLLQRLLGLPGTPINAT